VWYLVKHRDNVTFTVIVTFLLERKNYELFRIERYHEFFVSFILNMIRPKF
jgi:hypothetical protein